MKNLSVFLPAFNEEENIRKTVLSTLQVLKELNLNDFEIIVVNDGSKDKTAEVVKELSEKDRHIRLVSHLSNKGYGGALKTGFNEARFSWVAFTDSDGQFDFSEITGFIRKSDEAEVICGYRITRADSFARKVFTFGWKTLAWALFGISVKDYSCGFKVIKKEAYKAVLPLVGEEKVTQIEMLVKMKKKGFKFAEVGVHHYPRQFGKQTGANIKVVLKSLLDLMKLWWKLKDEKWAFVLLLLVLFLASFLRLYKIDQYMTFLGDEGRDALIIKRILTTGDLPLLGPPTSIGNIYLGPLYYYMMAVPMAIFWLNPVAAAVQVAIIGVLSILLIYYLSKEWFGRSAGLLSAFLYAISPVNIIYSRSSWNPNPTPFFALLSILGLYKAYKSSDLRWFILTGASLAFAVQMHYLALILLPVAGLVWLINIFFAPGGEKRFFLRGSIGGVVIFLFLMSPLVIFDLKHNLMNYRAVSTFFLQRETTINLNPLNTLSRIIPIYSHDLVGRYVAAENKILTPFISSTITLPVIFGFVVLFKQKKAIWPLLILGSWLFIGVLGLSLYKQTIYDHYLGFLNPVPFILFGALFLWKKKFVFRLIIILALILAFLNLQNTPFKNPPNKQIERTQKIARFVIEESQNKPYNFALIAKSNYDAAYQFYLDIYGYKPKMLPFDVTDQLFVVCEDPVCEPIGHPKYEIAAFGWAKIANVQEVLGVKVYKLVANPSGEPN